MDSEKMKNIMPGSLEEFQFILTVKQEEDVSQNELYCPKGSPQCAMVCEHKPCHKPCWVEHSSTSMALSDRFLLSR